MNDEQASRLSVTMLKPGDVMIARMPDPLGRACVCPVLPTRAVTVVDVCIVRAPAHNAKWLMHAINAPQTRTQIHSLQAGSTRKRISKGNLSTIPIPVPARPEQDRIVAAIETHFSRLDAAVASLTRAKANVKRARASVLKAAVEGRLVPTEAEIARAEGREYEPASVLLERILAARKAAWAAGGGRGKYVEPLKPETEGLAGLPEGWCWASIGQTADTQVGHAFQSNDFKTDGVNLLRGDNIDHGALRWGDRRRCIDLSALSHHGKLQMEAGDIVLAMDRPVISTGLKLATVTKSDLPALLVQRVLRLRPRIHPGYLLASMQAPAFVAHLESEAKGGGVPHISERQVQKFSTLLPPLPEQHRITTEVDRRLSVLDALDTTLDTNLARCARLRQSILKRAFEGRLVPPTGAPTCT